jgi:GTP-binding protein
VEIRHEVRNIAIVAHVDHGKTTLVDAMLRQSGAFRANQDVVDRVMDSGDLEREKGITILAKDTAFDWGGVKIHVVDTPGHADFGGEVERGLAMVDGVLLLVDASEGPLPQTRFVLRKALEARLPVVLVVNKVDRSDARVDEVVHEVEELFLDLGADEHQIDFPILYSNARTGWASAVRGETGTDLGPLFEAVLRHVPPPVFDPGAPLQALVCNLDASPYLGRLAVCRVRHGILRKGAPVAWCRRDGTVESVRITDLFVAGPLERVAAEEAGPGEIVAVAGMADITIGETLADPDHPNPLPPITVDEPNLTMTVGINTSPLSGSSGTKLTARQVKSRLDGELIGNVSIRVSPTDRPDAWEVMGRGELQLAVLVETMRREGFELTVGKPQVTTRLIDGVVHEPIERVSVDVPDEHLGTVTRLLASRKGTMVDMTGHGSGWVRLNYRVPARGLVGFRTEFLTETRGTGTLYHVSDGWEPWRGDMEARRNGSMVADRRGVATTHALMNLQERGTLFVGPGTEVYEGMIVGASARPAEMDVNPTKERKLTNVRSSTAEELERLTPPQTLSLEQALELIAEDECVEVTPDAVRLRKVILDGTVRGRLRSRARTGRASLESDELAAEVS